MLICLACGNKADFRWLEQEGCYYFGLCLDCYYNTKPRLEPNQPVATGNTNIDGPRYVKWIIDDTDSGAT